MSPSESVRGHHPSPAIAVLAALAVALAACGKDEPQASKPRASAPVQPPTQVEAADSKASFDANEALKERLARQEAASKLFEKSKPEPVTAPAPAPAPAKAPAPVPAKSVAAPAPAKTPEPAKAPEPVKVAEPAKAQEPPKAPEPVKLAAAAPTAPPALVLAKLVSRVDVDFPREAIQAGAERGNVKARMTLDGSGNVTRVDVVEATPRRVFDRAVVRSLSQWRFNEGPSGRTVETEVDFKR